MSIYRASSRGGEAVGYPISTALDDSGIVFLPLGSGTIILIAIGPYYVNRSPFTIIHTVGLP